MTLVAAAVAADIRRHGPIPLDRVLERALYDRDGGFYESGGRAGRQGDFLTSPEVGPLFGAVVARALDAWWRDLGSPDPYVVVEAGAGPGTLARTVLAAAPACAPALRYVLVERSAAQRRLHAQDLPLEDPALAFAPVDPDTEAPVPEAPQGPICVSLSELPRLTGPSVVLANELLDNLPFGLAERRCRSVARGPRRPGDPGRGGPERLVERLVPLAPERAVVLDRLAPDAPEGARVPWQSAAGAWLREALSSPPPAAGWSSSTTPRRPPSWPPAPSRSGCAPTPPTAAATPPSPTSAPRTSRARWPSTSSPWSAPRPRTCPRRTGSAGGAWTPWWRRPARPGEPRPTPPTVAALAARSRVTEADALRDPEGLGRFRVLEWSSATARAGAADAQVSR